MVHGIEVPTAGQRAGGAATAASISLVVLVALALTTASGVARTASTGCSLGIQGEDVSAFVGRAQTFRFSGYNAVPRGDRVRGVQISWGDGKTTAGTAATRSTPTVPGCYDTVFTARHTYTRTSCAKGALCGTVYHVTIRYVDARTGAKVKLKTPLTVDVLRPAR
jgi:hypothetical protein